MSKEIYYGVDARKKLKAGVDKITNAVKSTFGAKGNTVIISTRSGFPPLITKDGVTVARAVELDDPVEALGVAMVKEATIKTNSEVGDGTTNTAILTQAFIEKGMELIESGEAPINVKKYIDEVVAKVVSYLDEKKVEIDQDSDKLTQVASISANNDDEIGKLIAGAYKKVGKNGFITVEKSKNAETTVEYVEGLQFDRGYESQYFCKPPSEVVEMENPYILVSDFKFNNFTKVKHIIDQVIKAERPLIIICESMDDMAIKTLIDNRRALDAVVVKAPEFGEKRDDILEDIAQLTGATYMNVTKTEDVSNYTLEDLGSCKRLIVSKTDTTIIDGNGSSKAINTRIKIVESQLKGKKDFEKEEIEKRLAKLTGGIAILKVGGQSLVELQEKFDRVEDSLNTTKAALKEGVVAGGGIALLNSGRHLTDTQRGMFSEVLIAPALQILENAGYNPEVLGDLDTRALKLGIEVEVLGYDVKSDSYCNMMSNGIVDSALVIKTALKAAASIASTLLTTNCTITEKNNEDDFINVPGI